LTVQIWRLLETVSARLCKYYASFLYDMWDKQTLRWPFHVHSW